MLSDPMKHLLVFVLALVLAVPAWAQSRYGSAVTVADGAAFAGASGGDRSPGAVYVYRPDSGSWAEQVRLAAPDGFEGDGFGTNLAADGDMLAVGAPGMDGDRGAVFVFARTDDGWDVVSRLAPPADVTLMGFGTTVALKDGLLAVSTASQQNPWGMPDPSMQNAVYLYRHDASAGAWSQVALLDGTAAGAHPSFGSALALGDGLILVGAPGSIRGGSAPVVYPYRWNEADGTWTGTDPLKPVGENPPFGFGSTLAIDGGLAYVGAPNDSGTGAVFTYTIGDEGTLDLARTMRPFDGVEGERFGSALAVAPSSIWVGAPGAYRARTNGHVYVYRRDAETGAFADAAKMGAPDGAAGDSFGARVAASEEVAIVGAPGDDYGAGTAALFLPGSDTRWASASTVYSNIETLQAVTGERMGCQTGEAAGFDCAGMELMSYLPIGEIGGERGVRLNDIWGWTDPTTDREYALVGRVDGTSFVDVTNPMAPVYLGDLPKTEGSPGATWRDIKVYQDHAFIVADASQHHGMQVFDLTRLRDFDGTPATFEPDAWYGNIYSAHNIVINEDTGFAYVVGARSGGETCGGGLHMVNIQDPLNPTFAGCFADTSTGRRGTGYSHDAQCVVYNGPDEDYVGREICLGSNETALSIADVTDKENPKAIAAQSYPNVAYAHQGWLTEDHRYFYLNDEIDELSGTIDRTRTLIWDLTDLDDPQLVREFMHDIPASDHNLYVRGTTMYQSNYAAGLRVFDVADPENPVEVGYFDTNPFGTNDAGFSGSWSNFPYFPSGTVVVSSIGEGLFVLKESGVDS
ncbi:MAG: choice-of-anchor B family protein [Bacteroidota bacterium]